MRINKTQNGFTVVELMIATALFSVILLVCMSGFVFITSLLYKGVTMAKTEEVARNILDGLTEDARTSPSEIDTSNSGLICIGRHRYTYTQGIVYDGATGGMVLETYNIPITNCSNPGIPVITNNQLLDSNMRISNLVINCNYLTDFCNIDLRVASGQDEALGGSPSSGSTTAQCTGTIRSTQLCATVSLTTSFLGLSGRNI